MIHQVKITYMKSDNSSSCYLTKEQINCYGLSDAAGNMLLTLGALNVVLKKVIIDDYYMDSNRLYLSNNIKNLIYIPEGFVLQIRRVGIEQLELGPFIGVFINHKKFEYITNGKQIAAYNQYTAACNSLCGLCCFFSLNNIDWHRMLVKGLYKKNSKWVTNTLPLPKIIYDRNIDSNCRGESITLRKRLIDKCSIINAMPKLSKLATISALQKNPTLVGVIPETVPYNYIRDMEYKLRQHSSVYLKPDSLSKGKGVFKISKTSEEQYIVESRAKEDNLIVILESINDFNKLIRQYSSEGGGYLIQSEIKKAFYKGNTFDLRLLYQKNWEGVWQLSGIATRIAAPGSIITSPRSGGSVEDFSRVLKEVFNEDISTQNGLYERMLNLGREISITIDKEFGDCVELGIDMAIDINRKIWVIEVNGKPLKVSLKRLNNPRLIELCNKRPIEYAVYLTGFKSANTMLRGFKLS